MEQNEIIRLFDEFADDVYRLALSYLHNRQDAEDICQSVFLSLISRKKQLDAGKEKAWLLTCAANACKDHLRSFWRRHVVELDDRITVSNETEGELWDAVAALPPKSITIGLFSRRAIFKSMPSLFSYTFRCGKPSQKYASAISLPSGDTQ